MKPLLRKILIVALLIVAVVVTINLKGSKAISQKQQNLEVVGTELPKESTPVSIINEAGLPRFLELGADKCVPCKMMQPVLEELRREYPGKLQVDFIDVWKDPKQSQQYAISSIPTQIVFDVQGKEVFRHIGFFPKDQILKKFEELGMSLNKED
ncbi:MAG TPA: thioredoxin domain-containing protein [Atribacter sp.]|jgi:thioredoxin 1|uniref:thioredoxin family protein n=1 Tax=Atribacter sp. TaxID=2847780 RepID=UPI002C537C77|nr:thioredoxin domain-containing protein [Atribacter sp.]HQK83598.1 thioredoxin domain-containing protein [Atribacter sp.]